MLPSTPATAHPSVAVSIFIDRILTGWPGTRPRLGGNWRSSFAAMGEGVDEGVSEGSCVNVRVGSGGEGVTVGTSGVRVPAGTDAQPTTIRTSKESTSPRSTRSGALELLRWFSFAQFECFMTLDASSGNDSRTVSADLDRVKQCVITSVCVSSTSLGSRRLGKQTNDKGTRFVPRIPAPFLDTVHCDPHPWRRR